jgi:hypothetical protein
MWLNPYLQNVLIRDRIAEAREQAARRHLVREAKRSASVTHRWEAVQRVLRAAFTLSPKHRIERTVLP